MTNSPRIITYLNLIMGLNIYYKSSYVIIRRLTLKYDHLINLKWFSLNHY